MVRSAREAVRHTCKQIAVQGSCHIVIKPNSNTREGAALTAAASDSQLQAYKLYRLGLPGVQQGLGCVGYCDRSAAIIRNLLDDLKLASTYH